MSPSLVCASQGPLSSAVGAAHKRMAHLETHPKSGGECCMPALLKIHDATPVLDCGCPTSGEEGMSILLQFVAQFVVGV